MDAARVHTITNSLLKEAIMGNLQRYRAADLPALMERISKNSIGLYCYGIYLNNSMLYLLFPILCINHINK